MKPRAKTRGGYGMPHPVGGSNMASSLPKAPELKGKDEG